MIFNKNNEGSNELRILTGSYYKSNDFDKISVKVLLSSEELAALIGEAIFKRAENHYLSDNYLQPEPVEPEEPDSSDVDENEPDFPLLDQLVQHIQLPISFQATLWHYQSNDLSHEDSGRKMKIDPETEKIAWDWQYDRDDAAALRNYQKAFDRLIKFLNKYADFFPEWADSAARSQSLELFINTWEHFNRLYSIDNSPVFFLRLAPIMREVERKFIKPILGDDEFKNFKKELKDGEMENQELYEYICDPIPLLTMARAVRRFSLSLIPSGVVQNYFSERQTREASMPPAPQLIDAFAKSHEADGLRALNELKKFWRTIHTDESQVSIDDLLPRQTSQDKFLCL